VLVNLVAPLALGAEGNTYVVIYNQWVVVLLDEVLEEDVNTVSTEEWRKKIGANYSLIICYMENFLMFKGIR